MYVAVRAPSDYMVWRTFEGPPPHGWYRRFLPSIIESLEAMGVWLP